MCYSHAQANKYTQSQLVSMKTQDIGHVRQQSQAEAKVCAFQLNEVMSQTHLLLHLGGSLANKQHQQTHNIDWTPATLWMQAKLKAIAVSVRCFWVSQQRQLAVIAKPLQAGARLSMISNGQPSVCEEFDVQCLPLGDYNAT